MRVGGKRTNMKLLSLQTTRQEKNAKQSEDKRRIERMAKKEQQLSRQLNETRTRLEELKKTQLAEMAMFSSRQQEIKRELIK